MLYLRIQTLELDNITPEWVVSEIKLELETLSRIRRTDYLKDTMNGAQSSEIGFPMQNSSDDDDDEESLEESTVSVKESIGFRPNETGPGTEYKYREGMSSPNSGEMSAPEADKQG